MDEKIYVNAKFTNYMNNSQLLPVLEFNESKNLFDLTELINKVEGDVIEVGVYGGSAYLILNFMNKNKKLYLFDTFEGLTDVLEYESKHIFNGFARYSYDTVKKIFQNEENVILTKGYFPETATIIPDNTKFSFVHLDVDTYISTLNSLIYLYDRMTKNGIILTHDYNNIHAPGVRIAFDEFFKDKEEHIIQLWETQAMIIKI